MPTNNFWTMESFSLAEVNKIISFLAAWSLAPKFSSKTQDTWTTNGPKKAYKKTYQSTFQRKVCGGVGQSDVLCIVELKTE